MSIAAEVACAQGAICAFIKYVHVFVVVAWSDHTRSGGIHCTLQPGGDRWPYVQVCFWCANQELSIMHLVEDAKVKNAIAAAMLRKVCVWNKCVCH